MSQSKEQIAEVLGRHAAVLDDAAAAGLTLGTIDEQATAWDALGYDASAVEHWMERRCVSPAAASALGAASVRGDAPGTITDFGEGPPDTIAFKFAVGRINLADVLALSGTSTLLLDDERALGLEERTADVRAALAKLEDLEDLAELVRGGIYPSVGNDVVHRLTRAMSSSAQAIQALADGTFIELADYLRWDRVDPEVSEADGARLLAARLADYAQRMEALADEGRALFFGRENFNPCGWDLRVAMHDGAEVSERVAELRKPEQR